MSNAAFQDRPSFRAALDIGSQVVRIDEITDVMGRDPDAAHDIGDLRRDGAPRSWSRWSLELEFDDSLHRGCYGLAEAIVALGDDLADRASALRARGCVVSISVEQHIDPEDPLTDGIHVDEMAIAWLARAHASLDVDQYAEDATFRRAARLWADSRLWDLRGIRWFFQKRLSPRVRR